MTHRRDVLRGLSVLLILLYMFGGHLSSQPAKQKQQEDQDYTIRTTARLVLVDVSVKDAPGGFVSGLSKENFKVYDQGKAQEITQFGSADMPVTVGIAVDESGSMAPKRPQVIAAALQFIRASNPHY